VRSRRLCGSRQPSACPIRGDESAPIVLAYGLRRYARSRSGFPDVRSPEFTAEAHRQARLVAASHTADADQDFVDAISEWPGE
jgi:hypothetical protein